MIEITVFIASIFFLVYVGHRRRIGLISMYGIFVMFHLLYNIIPFLLLNNFAGFSLYSDPDVVYVQLWMSSISSLCFGIVFLFFFRQVPFARAPILPESMRRHYFLLAVPVFVLAWALASVYGWHELTSTEQAASGGAMFTITAYVKYWCIGIYLYYLYRFGLDKWAWALMGMHVVLMLIDNSRLTFLPILLFTLIILSSSFKKGSSKRKVYALAFLGIALSIFVRAVLSSNRDDRVTQAIAPVVVEGGLGDYATLQSIYIMKHGAQSSFLYGSTYILDPLAWLVPQGSVRDSFSQLQNYTKTNSNLLAENYAPWGGYYYLAEAVLNFGYLGPVIATTAFAFMLVIVDRNKNRMRMLYVAFVPTLGILFVKSIFGNVFKLFLIQVIILIAYRAFSALNKLKRVTRNPAYTFTLAGQACVASADRTRIDRSIS